MQARFHRFVFAGLALFGLAAAGCSGLQDAPDDPKQLLTEIANDGKLPKKQEKWRLAIAPVQFATEEELKAKPPGAPGGPAPGTTEVGDDKKSKEGGAGKEGSAPVDNPQPPPKEGGMRPRPRGEAQVAIVRYRRPLFREIMFAPKNAAMQEGAPPPAPAAPAPDTAPAAPQNIQWICPRCQNDVKKDDHSCPLCYLPFAPEVETPVVKPPVPVPVPAPAPAPEITKAPEPTPAPPPAPAPAPAPEVTKAPEPAPAAPPPPAPTAPTAPPAKGAERYVCFFCGKEVPPDVPNCPNCGLALEYPPGYEPKPGAGPAPTGGGVAIGGLAVREMKKINASRYAFKPDPDDLQNQLVAAMKEYKLFADVIKIPKSGMTKDEQFLQYAVDSDYNFLLVPTVTKWEISYEGISWRWIPSFLLAVAGEIPSWWVASDDFQAEIEMNFKLYNVRGQVEQPHWNPRYASGPVKFHVDQFDRGWYTSLSLIGVPVFDFIFDSGWKNMNDKIAPHAFHEVKKRLIEQGIYETFVKQTLPDVPFKTKKNVALLCGAPLFQKPGIRALRQVSADLDSMANTLQNFAGFEKKYIARMEPASTEEGRWATTQNIRAWLQNDLANLSGVDTVLLYFSGYGAAIKGKTKWRDGYEKYYITQDTDPANIAGTAFPLSEIGDALRNAQVQRAIVLLDCSFGKRPTDESNGFGRTLPQSYLDKAALAELTTDFFEDIANRGGGGRYAVAVMAAAVNQCAMEGDEINQEGSGGVFTFYFTKGIATGDADANGNKDGAVDLQEAIEYANTAVQGYAAVLGQAQDVQKTGDVGKMQVVLKKAVPKP